MARSSENEKVYDGTYVVKKSRKHNILAFILCVLIAFVIWLYATNNEKKEKLEENAVEQAQAVEAASASSEG